MSYQYEELRDLDPMQPPVPYIMQPNEGKKYEFIIRLYEYFHQSGFVCSVLKSLLKLLQFVFVTVLIIVLVKCVNYPLLFDERPGNNSTIHRKLSISDVFYSKEECAKRFDTFTVLVILVIIIYFLWEAYHAIRRLIDYREVGNFYKKILQINESDFSEMAWQNIVEKLVERQKYNKIGFQTELSILDINNIILRYDNYLVAMMNRKVLDFKFYIPIWGRDIVYLPSGLLTNIRYLIHGARFSFFDTNCRLKQKYKKVQVEEERRLSQTILFLCLINFLLSPVILLWRMLNILFKYSEMLKSDPTVLGLRRWSYYGKYYLRHLNELDHELELRLRKAYRPATQYLDSFPVPLLTIICNFISYISGAVLVSILFLAYIDEDVLKVHHLLQIVASCLVISNFCRAMIPKDWVVFCPEEQMKILLSQIHYMPNEWRQNPKSSTTRNELADMFQYTFVWLLEELLSPIMTPLALYYYVRPKSNEMLSFFSYYTKETKDIGDICDLGLFNTAKYSANAVFKSNDPFLQDDRHPGMMDGKLELSLMNFHYMNPSWKCNHPSDEQFIQRVKDSQNKTIGMEMSNIDPMTMDNSMITSRPPSDSKNNTVYKKLMASQYYDTRLADSKKYALSGAIIRNDTFNIDHTTSDSTLVNESINNSFASSMMNEAYRIPKKSEDRAQMIMSITALHLHTLGETNKDGELFKNDIDSSTETLNNLKIGSTLNEEGTDSDSDDYKTLSDEKPKIIDLEEDTEDATTVERDSTSPNPQFHNLPHKL
ncbi:hypothetical protein SNEBB_006476 [Seison nebaliae]|nr:hypothetical protein SNEBB_006476 [Seison nebaliae]